MEQEKLDCFLSAWLDQGFKTSKSVSILNKDMNLFYVAISFTFVITSDNKT